MKADIVSVYPKSYFSVGDIKRLEKHNLYFLDGIKNKINLKSTEIIFKSNNLILLIDPSYLKNGWNSLPNSLIGRMTGLKALCLATNSYDYIDIEFCKKNNIVVTNAPATSTNAVAEFSIFMMSSLLRNLPLIIKNNWAIDYSRHINNEFIGLKAGILGLGKIGSRVAELCKGLGMEVQFYNRSKKDVPYKKVSVEKLFTTSDVIFNTTAYNNETKCLVSDNLIRNMKNEALLVSIARPIYNHELVLDMVIKEKLGGYAFESNEKKVLDYGGNVMVFPEMAFYTNKTMTNIANELAKSVLSVINKSSQCVYNSLY